MSETPKTRVCSICKVRKKLVLANFTRLNRPNAYGFCFRCRPCVRLLGIKMRKEGKLTYAKRRGMLLRYARKNRAHITAREDVGRALASGKLRKENCKECGSKDVQAHHHKGYAKKNRLVVTWLCPEHHRQAHHGKH